MLYRPIDMNEPISELEFIRLDISLINFAINKISPRYRSTDTTGMKAGKFNPRHGRYWRLRVVFCASNKLFSTKRDPSRSVEAFWNHLEIKS